MEITCNRCHRTVEAESCYCPSCGLPQLQYSIENGSGLPQPEPGSAPVLDAGTVAWKPALRWALLLALPAGVLSSGLSPLGVFGLLWMTAASAWVVVLYARTQRPAWITIGAGARIGLVTGLLAGWLAFSVSGGALFVQRFVLHQSSQIDAEWKTRVTASQQLSQQWTAGLASVDTAQAQAVQAKIAAFMLSPGGHAGIEVFGYVTNSLFLLLFGVLGGAFSARLLARTRRPEI
jgi:hypothetical protein